MKNKPKKKPSMNVTVTQLKKYHLTLFFRCGFLHEYEISTIQPRLMKMNAKKADNNTPSIANSYY